MARLRRSCQHSFNICNPYWICVQITCILESPWSNPIDLRLIRLRNIFTQIPKANFKNQTKYERNYDNHANIFISLCGYMSTLGYFSRTWRKKQVSEKITVGGLGTIRIQKHSTVSNHSFLSNVGNNGDWVCEYFDGYFYIWNNVTWLCSIELFK